MPKTKTPVQILNAKRRTMLKKHAAILSRLLVQWDTVADYQQSALQQRYQAELRGASVSNRCLQKQMMEDK